ncbi:MAG: hypothetical protein LBQ27_02595 [Clostridiales bacterium]|jgi:hypothetical protein|nr:hypothetical protein [Clostridiales bacterium]
MADIKTTDTSAYKFSASNIGSTANLNVGAVYNTNKPAPAPAPVPVAPLTKKEQKAKDKADKKAAKLAKKNK